MGSFKSFINGGPTSKTKKSFNIYSLGSVELMELFYETISYRKCIEIKDNESKP